MANRQDVVILGTRVFAEEVDDLISDGDDYRVTAFGENWERARCENTLLGRPIVWVDDLAPLAATHLAVCAIGTTHRHLFVRQAEALGFRFATVRHSTARISRTSTVGPGSIVSAGVIVAAQTTIGSHVILNRGVLVGHHTRIGDYVTVSPGANIAGRITIGDGVYVGMGATVLDGLTVGSHAVVGAGSLVTRDVLERVQVMGVPARVVKEDVDGR
ncbi:MAG TPA: acetyltransferase [Candidatus Limnocylindrales bacterium]|nr:acetyltransferase [Candidatus Limnocylindrales bacterium]